MGDDFDFSMDSACTVKTEELFSGSGRLERLNWIYSRLAKSDLFFLQDGQRSKIIFQEAVGFFVNGQFIAAISLGFSFIERTIAGRLWNIGEKKLAQTRSNSKLLKAAQQHGWLTEGEVIAITNLRDVRNYVTHFRNPDQQGSKIKNIFEKKPASVDFEKNAYEIMEATIDVLSKTSL